jgi:hypothetical protein
VLCENVGLRKAVAVVKYVDMLGQYVTSDAAEKASTTEEELAVHVEFHEKFTRLKSFLTEQLTLCDDESLNSYNSNVLQTVEQVIQLTSSEITKGVSGSGSGTSKAMEAAKPALATLGQHLPSGMACPITLEVKQMLSLCCTRVTVMFRP